MKKNKEKRLFKQKSNHNFVNVGFYRFFSSDFVDGYSYWEIDCHSFFRSIKTIQEKRMWIAYEDEFKENGLNIRRRKRSNKSLIDSWDDINFSQNNSSSWKYRTKCKKQWEKNLN